MDHKVECGKSWFALYVKPKHEFKIREKFDQIGIHNYLPVVTITKQWHDRKKKITEPLIKSYIFIYADEKERLLSLESSSVIKCLFDQGRPARIPDWQIISLQNMLSQEGDFRVLDGLVNGAMVEIVEGPFKGVKGSLENIETGNRIAVSIELLNRSVVVHLPKESIIKKMMRLASLRSSIFIFYHYEKNVIKILLKRMKKQITSYNIYTPICIIKQG